MPRVGVLWLPHASILGMQFRGKYTLPGAGRHAKHEQLDAAILNWISDLKKDGGR